MRNILLAAAFIAASATLSSTACAHAHLEAAQPPINGTVKDAPTELDLKFSEELNLKFTGVNVTGPDKKQVETDGDMLMDGDKTFMVDLPAGLAAGTYKVEWHALSRDGHKTHGDYKFTVKP
ncbi:copper homeostasis periplasmic binding protein CopC [Mesorhizobium sp. B2-4-12]|uniref:copper homeostasis periplasmic binding protein CopC n=1 Tax=unclassified Mesorhizobium TaxID=325217 RepID=UPI00112DCC4A|nr:MULTISPECIES: copper homeostasis periplasmic binding protein CopC [unclassified Mesorhizobium]TPK89421.1 copper homeostasis periplasmic binding protein CopC [Mesorhizobium sp. B2-4-17]TPK92178.1 copper homeostasis periplasmic binding protein CopC [Mesorhizobium sp. B2-4-12]TPL06091.1 copper homeostasis periplasmic binding protein CopC [Mesorhizobium sp. B2-4-14]